VCNVCNAPRLHEGKELVNNMNAKPPTMALPFACAQAAASLHEGFSGRLHEAALADQLSIWLRQHRLDQYAGTLALNGFEDLEDLQRLDEAELHEVVALLGMPPGHAMRLRHGLREHFAGEAGLRECPVCLEGPQSGTNFGLVPCGHVFCSGHAELAVEQGQCPVCRGATEASQRFFA